MRKGENDVGGGEEDRGKKLLAGGVSHCLLPSLAPLPCMAVSYFTKPQTHQSRKTASYTGKIVSDAYVYNNTTEGKPENRPYVTSNNSPTLPVSCKGSSTFLQLKVTIQEPHSIQVFNYYYMYY